MLKKIIIKKLEELANTVRVLVYKENTNLLTDIDLNDDQIFLEPLILAYFNSKREVSTSSDTLSELMTAFKSEKKIKLSSLYNKKGIAYLPKLGYFKEDKHIPFSNICTIEDTAIEVMKYDIPLLRNIIHIVSSKNPIKDKDLIIDEFLFEANITPLTIAFQYYQKYLNNHFNIINIALKKCIFFQIKGKIGRSFTSINSHGTIFFNIYNDDHKQSEIYFIDNLGFYTGKMFFTSIFHDFKKVFKMAYNSKIQEIIAVNDSRNLYTVFLNFFTESNGAYCLNEVLAKAPLSANQKEEIELRLIFHFKKAKQAKKIIEELIKHYLKKENLFYKEAQVVYDFALSNYNEVNKSLKEKMLKIEPLNIHYRMKFTDFKDSYN